MAFIESIHLSSNLLALLVFSLVTAGIYRLLPKSAKHCFLLLASILFYCCCSIKYLAVMLLAGIWTFFSAKKIQQTKSKGWLRACIIPLALTLCLFKYWMPVSEFLGSKSGCGSVIKLILPLGMSYYILKSISYAADIYHGRIEAENNIVIFLSYITFFPQIIAGPIQRYKEWRPQMESQSDRFSFRTGFYYILEGLFMKAVIANRISPYVLETFSAPGSVNGVQLWIGFFLYSFYIYFDFAGYSNIAIGITQCFGIDCVKNFKRPYLAINLKDFWARWHISLSTWLRDYIYIPLGGNRKGKLRKCFNVMITFLVSGMWHGSTWNFIVWGGYHGILNSFTYKKRDQLSKWKIPLLTVVNFILVSVGWVFFGTSTVSDAAAYFKGMFSRLSFSMKSIQAAILPFTNDNTCLAFFIVPVVFIAIYIAKEIFKENDWIKGGGIPSALWYTFVLTSIILFGMFSNSSFIYAGF